MVGSTHTGSNYHLKYHQKDDNIIHCGNKQLAWAQEGMETGQWDTNVTAE